MADDPLLLAASVMGLQVPQPNERLQRAGEARTLPVAPLAALDRSHQVEPRRSQSVAGDACRCCSHTLDGCLEPVDLRNDQLLGRHERRAHVAERDRRYRRAQRQEPKERSALPAKRQLRSIVPPVCEPVRQRESGESEHPPLDRRPGDVHCRVGPGGHLLGGAVEVVDHADAEHVRQVGRHASCSDGSSPSRLVCSEGPAFFFAFVAFLG